jgi:cyanophycinase-like exopeptidase
VVAHTEGRAIADLIGLRAGLDPDVVLLALDAQTSCVHRPDGGWDVIGPGAATIVWPDHHQRVPAGGVLSCRRS